MADVENRNLRNNETKPVFDPASFFTTQEKQKVGESKSVFDPTSFFAPQKKQEETLQDNKQAEVEQTDTLNKIAPPPSPPQPSSPADLEAKAVESTVSEPTEDSGLGVKSQQQFSTPPPEEDDFEQKVTISMGDKIQRYPISRFRGIKGFVRRIAVITIKKWYAVKTHFEPGVGSFYCFESLCCDFGDPVVRYLVPVLVYDTDKGGNIISAKFTVEYLALSETYYEAFLLMNKSYPLDTIDILVSCADEQYQKLSYQPAGEASWLKNEAFKKQVLDTYARLERHILRRHARKLGQTNVEAEETYKRLKGGTEQNQSAVKFDLSQFLMQK